LRQAVGQPDDMRRGHGVLRSVSTSLT
jgi:hypothetical protein